MNEEEKSRWVVLCTVKDFFFYRLAANTAGKGRRRRDRVRPSTEHQNTRL
jgi:hypothetical protein